MVFLAIIGAVSFFVGLIARLGGMKGIYLAKGQGVIVPEALKYGFLPFGLYSGSIYLILLIPDADLRLTLFNVLGFPMLLTVVGLCIFRPRWLLPYWLNYLQDTYGYHQTEILLSEAREDEQSWAKKVETHEGLVSWAEETMAKKKRFPPS